MSVVNEILAATDGESTPIVGNLVGSTWRSAASGGWIDVHDPADERALVGRVPVMASAEVADAWTAAARAEDVWGGLTSLARADVLAHAATRIRELREGIARIITREMGKTLAEATGETNRAADFFDYYAGLAREPYGEMLTDARPDVRAWTQGEPVGPVLAITPWNDPLLTPARKLAPALFAGNPVVLKPATEAPLTALLLAAILREAGLPGGALNTVTGRIAEIDDALLDDPRTRAVTFTGSTEVGLALQRRLGSRNVRVETEMGGKNASVVLADADLELAAETIANAAFGQTGQRCTATSRVIVEAPARDRFLELLIGRAAAVRVGPGSHSSTTMGPLVSGSQCASVRGAIQTARAAGAALLYEDDTVSELGTCYVSPTIVEVSPAMELWRAEVFGPVISLLTVDCFEAAVSATNDSQYGLSAAVFTRDLAAAYRFVSRAKVGQVAVNLPTSGWDVHQPFGGWERSGSPFKEHGKHGLWFYTRVKTVALGLGASDVPSGVRGDTPGASREPLVLISQGSSR